MRLLPPVGCMILVTSRQYFNLPGLMAHNLHALTPRDARLLVRKIAKGVKVEEGNIIAKQCGYLPLALRLAAGLLNTRSDWTPADLIKKMHDALKLLGPVEASLDLSYAQLDDILKLHFRQLGVFPAPFDRKGVGVVWETDDDETDKILGLFLQASLLEFDKDAGRYELHDLLGAFAQARLSEEENRAASRRYSEHYMEVLSQADHLYLKGGENILAGLALYDREAEHIKAGQAWAVKTQSDLRNYYPNAGFSLLPLRLAPRDMINWLETALVASQQMKNKKFEGYHLGNLGAAYADLGETRKAIEFYEKRNEIALEIGNRRGEGASLNNLGSAYKHLGEIRKAIEFYEKALGVC